jgi:transposase
LAIVCPRRRFAFWPWQDLDPRRLELEQRLPPDHLARRLDIAVDRLDLSAFHDDYGRTGSPAYAPALLLKVVLYETRGGRHSPAQWGRSARSCEPVRWLLRGAEPSRSCWYAFRDRIAPYLEDWNRQVLTQAVAQGQTTAQRGAVDGTTIAANASRRRLLDESALQRRLEQLRQAKADPTATQRPAWMAPTPEGRRRQEERLGRTRERMEQLQRRNAGKRASKRKKRERIVVSASDPEAALGRDKEGVFRPLYNVQVVDDLDSPLILAYDVLAQPNDAGLLGPMLARLRQALGRPPQSLLMDSAYAGGADLAAAAAEGVTVYAPAPPATGGDRRQLAKAEFEWLADEQAYRCPRGQRLTYAGSSRQKRSGPETISLQLYRCATEHCRDCPLRSRCTPRSEQGRTISRSEHEELSEALQRRMATAEAKELYRLRGRTVELVNADWKTHRRLRRFSARGLNRVRCQVGVLALTQNLLTLLTAQRKDEKSTTANPSEVAA